MFGRGSSGRRPSRTRERSAGARRAAGEGALETVVFEPGARPRGSTTLSVRPRLVDQAAEWLLTIVALRRASEIPDPAGLRARFLELKAAFEQEARTVGASAADIEASSFAMVAFLDESVLRSRGAARDAWVTKPLQLELYGQNVAGEEFFTRLERLRRERESRIEALEVSLACLAFGFVGRYGLVGPEKLGAMIGEVEGDVAAVRGASRGPLAPNATRRDAASAAVGEKVPIWLSLALFVPATLLAWLVISLLARAGAGRAAAAIDALLAR